MKYKAKCDFLHDQLGRVYAGQVIELQTLSGVRAMVEPYETKVVHNAPLAPAAASLSASQAAQALPQTTASASENGGKKKRSKSKGE